MCCAQLNAGNRRGLSLLEVILSLSILMIAMILIGDLVGLGNRSAAIARDMTRAQLLCESKLVELTSGGVLPVSQSALDMPEDPEWQYSVHVQPLGTTGLAAITVTVKPKISRTRDTVEYALTRWVIDRNAPHTPWSLSATRVPGL